MNSEFLTALPERIGWTLLHSTWQFAAVAIGLFIILAVLRKSMPTARYAAEFLSLVAMVVCGVSTFFYIETQTTPSASVALLSAQPHDVVAEIPSTMRPDVTPRPDANSSSITSPAAVFDGQSLELNQNTTQLSRTVEQSRNLDADMPITLGRLRNSATEIIQPWLQELCLLWLIGIGFFSIRAILSLRRVQRLRRFGTRSVGSDVVDLCSHISKRMRIRRIVSVVQSSLVDVPTVIGWLRPIIFLPASSLTGLSQEQIQVVIAHELAHIRRHDYLVNSIQVLVETIFFYHPAVWWVSHRMRMTREECCDDIVVRLTGDRRGYARVLLWLEEHRTERPRTIYALSASGGSLLDRIRRIVRPEATTNAGPGLVVIASLFCLMIAGSGLWMTAIAEDESTSEQLANDSNPATDTDAPFVDIVSRKFADSVGGRDLPYMKPEQVQEFATELREYLSQRIDNDLDHQKRIVAADAVHGWASRISPKSSGYLNFRGQFDMLCWQLWTYAERKKLTTEQLAHREEQRDWIRNYMKGLPAPKSRVKDWQLAGRLKLLEQEVFQNPLSPFFYDPMSDQEFEDFKDRLVKRQQSLGGNRLIHAPSHIFMAAVYARVEDLREKYPPGFPVGGLSIGNTTEFGFRAAIFPKDARYWLPGGSGVESKRYYEADRNITIDLPDKLDFARRSDWLAKKGVDLHFDAKLGQIIPHGDSKLAVLKQTEWHKIDQISTEELKRLAQLQSFDIGPVRTPNDLVHIEQKLEMLPTGVLLTKSGKVVLFRVEQLDMDSVYLFFRPRPLVAYRPFHHGSEEKTRAGDVSTTETRGGRNQRSMTIAATESHAIDREDSERTTATFSGRILSPDGSPSNSRGWMYYNAETETGSYFGTIGDFRDSFEFTNLAGEGYIVFFPDGYAPVWSSQLETHAGDHLDGIDLKLKQGMTASVQVRDAEGQPVIGASVVALPRIYGSTNGPVTPHATDDSGNLTLNHLADTAYEFRVKSAGFEDLRTGPESIQSGTPIVLKLTKARPTTGRVVDSAGAPVAGAKLRAKFELNQESSNRHFRNEGEGFYGEVMATTDAEGRFTLDSLSEGSRYLFIIEGPDESRLLYRDFQVGQKDVGIRLPPRRDVKIGMRGSLDEYFDDDDKRYVNVRQTISMKTAAGTSGDLVGGRVMIEENPTGGSVVYRGLVVDPENDFADQTVRVEFGTKKRAKQTLKLLDQPATSHTWKVGPIPIFPIEYSEVRTDRIKNGLLLSSGQRTHLVLVHTGFLQTGLTNSNWGDTEHSHLVWRLAGKVNAFSGRREVIEGRSRWENERSYQLLFEYGPPRLKFRIDGRTYDLSRGRVIVLRQDGDPIQLDLEPPKPSERDDRSLIDNFNKAVDAKLKE